MIRQVTPEARKTAPATDFLEYVRKLLKQLFPEGGTQPTRPPSTPAMRPMTPAERLAFDARLRGYNIGVVEPRALVEELTKARANETSPFRGVIRPPTVREEALRFLRERLMPTVDVEELKKLPDVSLAGLVKQALTPSTETEVATTPETPFRGVIKPAPPTFTERVVQFLRERVFPTISEEDAKKLRELPDVSLAGLAKKLLIGEDVSEVGKSEVSEGGEVGEGGKTGEEVGGEVPTEGGGTQPSALDEFAKKEDLDLPDWLRVSLESYVQSFVPPDKLAKLEAPTHATSFAERQPVDPATAVESLITQMTGAGKVASNDEETGVIPVIRDIVNTWFESEKTRTSFPPEWQPPEGGTFTDTEVGSLMLHGVLLDAQRKALTGQTKNPDLFFTPQERMLIDVAKSRYPDMFETLSSLTAPLFNPAIPTDRQQYAVSNAFNYYAEQYRPPQLKTLPTPIQIMLNESLQYHFDTLFGSEVMPGVRALGINVRDLFGDPRFADKVDDAVRTYFEGNPLHKLFAAWVIHGGSNMSLLKMTSTGQGQFSETPFQPTLKGGKPVQETIDGWTPWGYVDTATYGYGDRFIQYALDSGLSMDELISKTLYNAPLSKYGMPATPSDVDAIRDTFHDIVEERFMKNEGRVRYVVDQLTRYNKEYKNAIANEEFDKAWSLVAKRASEELGMSPDAVLIYHVLPQRTGIGRYFVETGRLPGGGTGSTDLAELQKRAREYEELMQQIQLEEEERFKEMLKKRLGSLVYAGNRRF